MHHIKKRKIFTPIVMASLITTLGVGTISIDPARASTREGTSVTASFNTTGSRYGFGKGRGQGASGIVTAISGSSMLTITGKNNLAYAVDTSGATLLRASTISSKGKTIPGVPVAIAFSDIKVGDTVMVRGSISGNSIKAVTVTDGKKLTGKSKVRSPKVTALTTS